MESKTPESELRAQVNDEFKCTFSVLLAKVRDSESEWSMPLR